jgi:hypothetical protein
MAQVDFGKLVVLNTHDMMVERYLGRKCTHRAQLDCEQANDAEICQVIEDVRMDPASALETYEKEVAEVALLREQEDYRRGAESAREFLASFRRDYKSVQLAGYLDDAQTFVTPGLNRNYMTDGFGDALQKGLVAMLRSRKARHRKGVPLRAA